MLFRPWSSATCQQKEVNQVKLLRSILLKTCNLHTWLFVRQDFTWHYILSLLHIKMDISVTNSWKLLTYTVEHHARSEAKLFFWLAIEKLHILDQGLIWIFIFFRILHFTPKSSIQNECLSQYRNVLIDIT